MVPDAAQQRPLSGRIRLEASIALLPALAAFGWIWRMDPPSLPLSAMSLALIAVPLFARTRRSFIRRCLVIGSLSFPVSAAAFFFLLFQVFLFLPAAVVLLPAAGLAAGGTAARTSARVGAWAIALLGAAGFGLAIYRFGR